jgi:alanine racemase
MTHFANADSTDLSFAHEQVRVFNQVRHELERNGLQFEIVHAANTAAALALPEARFDMVRSGILLSGHLPAPHLRGLISLSTAVTVRSKIARVFRAKAGATVGYGRTWTAKRDSVVGLVPVGYGDGYFRVLSNRAHMLVSGLRCSVAGRVSMDQTAVDLTDVPGAREGDEVVLIGRQEQEEITADELAAWAETISYEVFCGLSPRVPRHYWREGQVVEVCNLLGCSTSGPALGEQHS